MFWLRLIYTRLYGLLRKNRIEQEMEDEMRFHLLMRTRENIERGMRPEEAARAARRHFGNVGIIKDLARDIKGGGFMETLLQDLRFGARMLVKQPGFTFIAILTLALGIGANTAIFTLANALLFRPPAVKQPERLVMANGGRSNGGSFSYPDVQDYQQRSRSFEGLAAFIADPVNVGSGQQNELAVAEYVSANFFTVLGVDAGRGRVFTAEDGRAMSATPVAVIGSSLWRRLGQDADIVGKTIAVNQGRYTVIGVAAEGFKGVTGVLQAEVWISLEQAEQHVEGFARQLTDREVCSYQILGRLKPGVALQQAQAELQTIDQALDREFPRAAQAGVNQPRVRPLSLERIAGTALPGLKQQVAPIALLLLAVVGIVLLLACTNVANLLLARAAARRREIAVRLSLGASRFRLIRQLMTESSLLAALGACAGIFIGVWATRLMTTSLPALPFFAGLRITIEPAVDGHVLGFTIAVAVLSVLLFGLLPAFQATKPNLITALKVGAEAAARSSTRFNRRVSLRNLLVVAQLSLSLLLLISAGLFVRSLQNASSIDPGFKPDGRLVMWINPTPQKQMPAYTAEFYQRALERVRALPGVQTTSLISYLPISLVTPKWCYAGNERATANASQPTRSGYSVIAPDYFEAIGIPLRQGRDFNLGDTGQTPGVAIVNETLAHRLWPDANPLGRQLRSGKDCSQLLTVVGLAANSQYTTLGEAPQPHLYVPFAQQPEAWGWRNLVIHAPGANEAMLQTVSRELQALAPGVAIQQAQPLNQHLDFSLWPARGGAAVLGSFGLLALVLACAGIFGVMSYTVSQRTQEFGVRMALGAQKQDILTLVLRDGLILIMVGLAIGLSLASLATRLLTLFLYGVSATDQVTFAVISLLLAAAALFASYLPARRATQVDPLAALRHE
jgi:macrolide transport system ATP-binding/permease protein